MPKSNISIKHITHQTPLITSYQLTINLTKKSISLKNPTTKSIIIPNISKLHTKSFTIINSPHSHQKPHQPSLITIKISL